MTQRILILVVVLLVCSSCTINAREGNNEDFKVALGQDGFDVQNGKLIPLNIPELYCAKVLPSCYGNNSLLDKIVADSW